MKDLAQGEGFPLGEKKNIISLKECSLTKRRESSGFKKKKGVPSIFRGT